MLERDAGKVGAFGVTPGGDSVQSVVIRNGGTTARIITWGATLQDFRRAGTPFSLVLGAGELGPYLAAMRYFGAIVGPVANRIGGGRFTLDGRTYDLDRNEGGLTTLHGGAQGFGQRLWEVIGTSQTACRLRLQHRDGQGGFPGNIDARASYFLEEDGALRLEITATTDKPTVFNPAFHGYWNLDGSDSNAGHRLRIDAERYLPVDDRMIPVGAPAPVAGSVFDYRAPRTPDPDLDHNFCLSERRCKLREVCVIDGGGLRLAVETTEPGLQAYSGGMTDSGAAHGHGGRPYGRRAGIALEPQIWPDAPNRPDFPSARLDPGQLYHQITRFRVRPMTEGDR